MNLSILNVFRIPELRSKLFYTFGLLLIYRVGFHVPLPGVNVDALNELARKGGNDLFGLMSSLSGGNLGSALLFSLGVMPYISASIIFSLLAKVVPSLEKLSKEGAAGQRKINQYTRLATIPICLLQSMFVIFGVLTQKVGDQPIVYEHIMGWPYILGVMVALTAGTLFIMWIGEQITEHGIGNGISIIIMAGIIANMPQILVRFFSGDAGGQTERYQALLWYIFSWIAIVLVIVYITKGQRRIPIQQAKLTRGRKVYGGQRHFLPFKVNQAGVMPIIFASALMILPNALSKLSFFQFLEVYNSIHGFWYIVTYCTLIVFFAFFWVQMMFQPKDIANNLREHGSFIPGIRPGAKTSEFLQFVITRVTLAGSVFLAVVAIVPNLITRQIGNLPPALGYFLGGTSILIVVEVALDMIERLNAQLVMKNYDGFMKGEAASGWGRKART